MTERPLILERTDAGDRIDARARWVAAAVTLPASLALLLDDPGAVRTSVALGGLVASVAWGVSARRALAAPGRVRSTLTLGDDGLTLEADGQSVSMTYEAIRDLDLDDDAACLHVLADDGRTLSIEPGHGGLDAPAVASLLRRRMQGGNP